MAKTHNGYFSIDKKSKRLIEPELRRARRGSSDDVDAYDLILKDKERLLSFAMDRPSCRRSASSSRTRPCGKAGTTRTCSSSARSSTATTPFPGVRRSDAGCGCRSNQHGDRMDDPATVHE